MEVKVENVNGMIRCTIEHEMEIGNKQIDVVTWVLWARIAVDKIKVVIVSQYNNNVIFLYDDVETHEGLDRPERIGEIIRDKHLTYAEKMIRDLENNNIPGLTNPMNCW